MYTSQLECFVTLASTLNYMKTAEQLGLTQPAVSKQIQALEQELGARLFLRTTRSVSLTQVGQQFLPDAETMLNTYYRSRERVAGFSRRSRHLLRIGYSDPHSINKISQVLKTMLQEYKNIVPELFYEQTDANLNRLSQGQIDVVVGMKDAKYTDEHVSFHKIREESFLCVLSRTHPLAAVLSQDRSPEDGIATKELWPYRQIISIPPYLMKSFFSRGHRIVPVNEEIDNIICNNTNEAYGLLIAGVGYAYVPKHLILDHPELVFWKWAESPHAPFGIYHCKLQGDERSEEIRTFLRMAETVYADL